MFSRQSDQKYDLCNYSFKKHIIKGSTECYPFEDPK